MIKVDLHLHSFYSPDAISSPQAICAAAMRKGLNAIALTDHDTTTGWEAVREAAEQAGLLFIPGEERKVIVNGRVVGEVLCLFLREPVQSRDLAGIIGEVESQGGLVVAAHPFDRRRPALGRYEELAEYH
ncbi:MAG: PHP domain-containing protein, partial [Candidatus Latescibacteria bacterium]|nr:PHP domain-containing protein [Candidatus Latescibacterota bacterium]